MSSVDAPEEAGANLAQTLYRRDYSVGILLAIVLLGTAMRLYELDADSFWADEIITARVSQLPIPTILGYQSELALNPPLTFFATHFFFSWGGQSEFTARLLPALLGSLSILLIYAVGEMLWTRRDGIVAAFLLAVSAHHVQYSQEARQYALMLFLALLSVLFLLKALQKNEMRFWLGFILCTSLGLYNHYFAILLFPAELVYGAWVIAEKWLSHRRENAHTPQVGAPSALSRPAKQALLFSLSLVVVGISYLLWVPTLQAQISQQTQSGTAGITTASLQSTMKLLSQVPEAYAGGGGILLLLWFAVLLLGLAACDWKRIALSLLWMGTPFAFLGVVGVKHSVHLRYILFTLPIYLLIAARGITSLGQLLDRFGQRTERIRAWSATPISVLCVLVLGAASALSTRTYYLRENEDWRTTARYLADNMATGDIILVDGTRYGGGGDAQRVSSGLSYYLTSYRPTETPIMPVGRQLWAGLHSHGPFDGDVWGALWGLSNPPPADMIAVVDFHKVSIIRLRQPSGDAVRDTLTMLHALLDLLPQEAHFDVYLALEEIYLWTGRYDEAQLELDMAGEAKPKNPQAARDLSEARAELEQVSRMGKWALRPLRSYLGGLITLLGYSVDPVDVKTGEPLTVTLRWQAVGAMDKDYTVFIHLVGRDGHIWAQDDRLLEHGGVLTSAWRVGQLVPGQYRLEVPPDAPQGEYSLFVGLYYWETGERLPVWDENGERVEDDAVLLETIVVSQ